MDILDNRRLASEKDAKVHFTSLHAIWQYSAEFRFPYTAPGDLYENNRLQCLLPPPSDVQPLPASHGSSWRPAILLGSVGPVVVADVFEKVRGNFELQRSVLGNDLADDIWRSVVLEVEKIAVDQFAAATV